MNNNNCKMQGCIKPVLIGTVAVAIVLFAIEYLVHGVWLMPIYEATASLWRTQEEMRQISFPWCIIRLLAIGFLITVLYCKCAKKQASCDAGDKPCCPWKRGICFGMVVGSLMGVLAASSYLWMPIPLELAVKWFIGGLAEGVAAGLVLSHLSRLCKKDTLPAA